jgi:hypothetical protein
MTNPSTVIATGAADTSSSAQAEPASSGTWRRWNLVVLTSLSAYSTALAWQAQLVSYPLYRAVGAGDFIAYHERYGASIPLVVIVPGFATFLAATAFYWTRPAGIGRRSAAAVSVAGLVSLLSTVLWAIPRHADLDRIGRSEATIDSLLRANLLRSLALTTATVVLGWGLGRLLTSRSTPDATVGEGAAGHR